MVVSEFAAAEDLPCADVALLVPLRASAEYAAIGGRLAMEHHLDSWQEDGLHFFVFQLLPADGAANGHRAETEAPVAVFAMQTESTTPVSAVVVTPHPGGAEAEIRDLRTPDTVYVAPVSP